MIIDMKMDIAIRIDTRINKFKYFRYKIIVNYN